MQKRDASFETLRGLAALAVLFSHSLLAFLPDRIFAAWPGLGRLDGWPIFGLVNGTAAVAFFFLLSGFVLTRHYLLTGDIAFLRRNAAKRWPRLAGPVIVATLLSWALFHFHLYRFEEAGRFVGSRWLQSFAYQMPFDPGLSRALAQGLHGAFFHGEAQFNSVLWTMQYEIYGSILVFGLALMFRQAKGLPQKLAIFLTALLVVCYLRQGWYVTFIFGVFLAAILPEREMRWPAAFGISAFVIAFYLAGYSRADLGAYHPFFLLSQKGPNEVYVWTVASVLIIVAVRSNPLFYRLLSHRWGARLGWLSFPVYLVHFPILSSVGAATLLWTKTFLPLSFAFAAAFLAFLAITLAAAIGLALLNDRWIAWLNQAVSGHQKTDKMVLA